MGNCTKRIVLLLYADGLGWDLTFSPTSTPSKDQPPTNLAPSAMRSPWSETMFLRHFPRSLTLSTISIFWMLGSPLPSFRPLFLPRQGITRFHPRETVPRNTVGSSLKASYSTRRFPLPGPNNLILYFALLYRATEFMMPAHRIRADHFPTVTPPGFWSHVKL